MTASKNNTFKMKEIEFVKKVSIIGGNDIEVPATIRFIANPNSPHFGLVTILTDQALSGLKKHQMWNDDVMRMIEEDAVKILTESGFKKID